MKLHQVTILIFVGSVARMQADLFASTENLQHVLLLERQMAGVLDGVLKTMELKLDYLRNYLKEYYRLSHEIANTKNQDDYSEFIENPLHVFHMIKRLAVEWSGIRQMMLENDWDRVEEIIHSEEDLLPRDEDLQGAALALVRLQYTYNLNTTDMAQGRLSGINSISGLTARDCLYLGKHAFNNGYYGHAIEWLEEAISRANLERNQTVSVEEITLFLDIAIRVHDDVLEGSYFNNHAYETLGHLVRDTGDTKRLRRNLSTERKLRRTDTSFFDYENYVALCRGERLRTAREEVHLRCRYTSRGHPYLILQPVKVEEQSLDPYIVQFYDLMTSREADTIQEIATPMLTRSRVQGQKNLEDEVSTVRTSKTAWLKPEDHPIVDRINRRVQYVTGLSTDVQNYHCETVQTTNYGVGGHYEPHYDFLYIGKTEEQLTDVTRGGATVFPKVGAGVWPLKGSAVFWYNLKKNGTEDNLTLHGACPVLHGRKWVANYWIREKGQMLRRPCSLNQEE
ncbi:prolyl 4-hydroxylase subunit alpha-1-like [Limulus polyphemus]|uniref:procollagen-proline 4-dioxygenase n=1 Tax=Limulus polyphemus TaxID=6850 RepID=A0ABM1SVT1_LIMPO|nr:prolyl 4-hydroxylase subunit alpha-1-like [Limulus polyphemus]